ncbi:MAG: NAD(P)/FAD-dependent oxidoreductase [Actinomycetota bacterium]|nr:NAD(P)/FAD-dependent oxidoreductase [Actinomycetota bacterium]
MTTDADVLIVGAGSAGLSAALMLARSRRRVIVLDGGPPRNAAAAHMHGVLGRDGWSPVDLVATGRDEVLRYGATIEPQSAVSAVRDGSLFTVTLEDGTHRSARRLLIAGGLRDELPAITGLDEHWGSGVAHCPYCHGWEVRDSRIAVVASGPASLHQVQLVRQLSPHVTYVVEGTELPEPDLAALVARGIGVETRRIASVLSVDGAVSGLRMHDGSELAIDAIFVRPRSIPADGLLHALGAASEAGPDDHAWISVDGTGRTSIPGLWAAGNVVNPSATVPVTAAAGSTAGAAINADLVHDEVQRALRANNPEKAK